MPNGTNLFMLAAKGVKPEEFQQRALEAGVTLAAPAKDHFAVAVNESWNRVPPQEIVGRFVKALG